MNPFLKLHSRYELYTIIVQASYTLCNSQTSTGFQHAFFLRLEEVWIFRFAFHKVCKRHAQVRRAHLD